MKEHKYAKVSVIIPVYNSENYIERCFESVRMQTYDNIEIIFVNDGSTDNSLKLLNRFAKLDNRIIIIDQENLGVAEARNTGLKKSTGEYICFVDSDDWIEANMIERMLLAMNGHNHMDIAICDFDHVLNAKDYPVTRTVRYDYWNRDDALLEFVKNKKIPGMLWAKLFRRSLIKDEGFLPCLRFGEDCDFLWRVLKKANHTVGTNEVLYHNIQNDMSLSRTPFSSDQFSLVYIWRNIVKDIHDNFAQHITYEKLFFAANETFVQQVVYTYYHMKKARYDNYSEFEQSKKIICGGGIEISVVLSFRIRCP